MQLLRSFAFTLLLMVWTFSYAVFFIAVAWALPLERRYALVRWYARRIFDGLGLICGLRFDIQGTEHIPAEPHVAFWKHSSAWETFAQFMVGPSKVIVLKHELMYVPFFGWGLALLRSIPVNRGAGSSAVAQVLEHGRQRLAEGLSVLVFPEGTRMAPGATGRYGISGALLASSVGCKVVPVAHDAGYYWARRGLLKKPGIVRVRVGPPIDAAGREPRSINDEAQAWIEQTVASLRAEAATLDTASRR